MLMMSVIISDLNHRRTQQTVLHRTGHICKKENISVDDLIEK